MKVTEEKHESEYHPLVQWKRKGGDGGGGGDSDYPGCSGLPWHLTEKPNDLFESQHSAPWWKARTENSEANKSSQVCKDSDMGVPAPASTAFRKVWEVPFSASNASEGGWLIFFFSPHRRGCLNVLMHCSVTQGCLGKLPFLQTDLPFDWMRPG